MDILSQVRAAIDSHTHAPGHPSRWPESQILREILACSTLLWANLTSVESILELTQWKTTVQDLMFVIDNYVYLGLGNIAALDTTRILEISLLLAQMFIGVCRQLTRLTHVRPIGMVVRQPLLQSIVPRWASGSLWIELPWISQIARHWSIGY